MKIEQIGGIRIRRERPVLILEAGVNHGGSLDTALAMVDAAADAGADLIKFQSYKAETLASRHSPAYWDQREESAASQFELFERYDRFGDAEYRTLHARCQERGIGFLSTPFDRHFEDALEPLMSAYKVASADITNHPALRRIAAKGKPVLLSVGASHLSEIDEAVRVLEEAGAQQVALLHCVLEYPTQPGHANLAAIAHLQEVFPDVTVGWSDHVTPVHGGLSLLVAWMAGADILEKHFTLDKSLPGNDHYHALDADDVRAFWAQQRAARELLGVRQKTVLACEEPARKYARRSLVARVRIPAGTVITRDLLIAKRPGTGISPRDEARVVGAVPLTDIEVDELLTWDKLISTPEPRS